MKKLKVRRTGKFRVKKNHPDYELIKLHKIEAKETYNYANYIIRQLFFKKSGKENFSLNFINEYPELAEDFRIKGYSLNSKMVQGIVNILKRDWKSYWKLLKLKINGKYDKSVNIPRYKRKYSIVEYNPQVISRNKLKNGYIGTSKMNEGFKIPKFYKE